LLIKSDWLKQKKVTWSEWNRKTIPLASSNFFWKPKDTHVN